MHPMPLAASKSTFSVILSGTYPLGSIRKLSQDVAHIMNETQKARKRASGIQAPFSVWLVGNRGICIIPI